MRYQHNGPDVYAGFANHPTSAAYDYLNEDNYQDQDYDIPPLAFVVLENQSSVIGLSGMIYDAIEEGLKSVPAHLRPLLEAMAVYGWHQMDAEEVRLALLADQQRDE